MSPNLAQCVVLLWIRLIQPIWFAFDLFVVLCPHYSTLSSPLPFWQDFSKRASFPIACEEWLYKKAVLGVVKSWEFEGTLRCSKILRIRRKNPRKWVLSISRDYWVYLDITLQSFEIWELWGEFWWIETSYRSKFSFATGVTSDTCPRCFLETFIPCRICIPKNANLQVNPWYQASLNCGTSAISDYFAVFDNH